MTLLAAVASALAVVMWRPSAALMVTARLGPPSGGHRPLAWTAGLLAPSAAAIGVVVVSVRPALVVLAGTAGVLTAGAVIRWRRRRIAGRIARCEAEHTELVLVLAAALRAGLPAPTALGQVAEEFAVLAPAAQAARLGGDVVAALLQAGERPGGQGLRRLAAAWCVAESTGAPLADVLHRLSLTEREERDVRREVQAGVAPARATALLMAVLPVFGLLLGSGLGGDPMTIMTQHLWVAVVVAVGVLLAAAGVLWIDRIADTAERGPA